MAAESIDLRRQAMVDIAQRARGGLYVHFVLWLIAGELSGVHRGAQAVYLAVAACFAVLLLLRWRFELRLAQQASQDRRAHAGLYLLLLSNPLLWGAMVGLALLWTPMVQAREVLSLVVVGLMASGSIVFAIDHRLSLAYGATAMVPPALAALVAQHELWPFYSTGAVLLQLYLLRVGRAVHEDYWLAARANRDLRARSRELELLACTDALTGVANRQQFESRLVVEHERALLSQVPLSLLMIDVDHFKQVNDLHGHPGGDTCLRAVACALADNLRGDGDFLARYGGEEFAVLLPGAGREQAMATAERLRLRVFALQVMVSGHLVPLSCSIGVQSRRPDWGDAAQAWVASADVALYAAKHRGRNCVVHADECLPARALMPAAVDAPGTVVHH